MQVSFVIDVFDQFFNRRHWIIRVRITGDSLQPMTKTTQTIQRLRHELLLQPHFGGRGDHADITHRRVFTEFFDRAWANFTTWSIHNP